ALSWRTWRKVPCAMPCVSLTRPTLKASYSTATASIRTTCWRHMRRLPPMLKRIIDGLELNAYHTRSISLSRDLLDETAISSYLPTPNAVQALKQIGTSLAERQSQRAWKVVGPYGS